MTASRRSTAPQAGQYALFDSTMPLRADASKDLLPASARELVEVIGIDATIDLVKMFDGDDIKIPEVADGTSRMWALLVETVGHEAASKLVSRYAGTMLFVPKCAAALREHRDRDIIRRFDAGEPFDKLRRELKVTRRHMYRILKKPL